jgi:hypothetical protein
MAGFLPCFALRMPFSAPQLEHFHRINFPPEYHHSEICISRLSDCAERPIHGISTAYLGSKGIHLALDGLRLEAVIAAPFNRIAHKSDVLAQGRCLPTERIQDTSKALPQAKLCHPPALPLAFRHSGVSRSGLSYGGKLTQFAAQYSTLNTPAGQYSSLTSHLGLDIIHTLFG